MYPNTIEHSIGSIGTQYSTLFVYTSCKSLIMMTAHLLRTV